MLDGTLIFCKDGILRFQSLYDDKTMVPVIALQEVMNTQPAQTVIALLRNSAVLESGTTVGSFLLCLHPWANEMNWLTDRQVTAYIAEIRKPSAEVNAFDRVEIRRRIHAHRSMIHDPMPDDVDFIEWLNRERDLKWSDSWEVSFRLDICGYDDGDPANYSMSTDVHALKNVPLLVNQDALLLETYSSACDKPNLFNPTTVGAKKVEDRNLIAVNATVDNPISFKEMVEVVICDGLWHNTPQGAINMRALLMERMAEAVEELEEAVEELKPTALRLVGDENEEKPEEQHKTMTVKVADGAFSGLAESMNHHTREWHAILAAVDGKTDHVIRIGTYTEDTAPDNRLMGGFIE